MGRARKERGSLFGFGAAHAVGDAEASSLAVLHLGMDGGGGDARLPREAREKGRLPALVIRESRRACKRGRNLELQAPAEAPTARGRGVGESSARPCAPEGRREKRAAGSRVRAALPALAPGGADPRDSGAAVPAAARRARGQRRAGGAAGAGRGRGGGAGRAGRGGQRRRCVRHFLAKLGERAGAPAPAGAPVRCP